MLKDKFIKSSSKIDRGICLIIYSNGGVGKTYTSATLPVNETLIISVEAGIGPLLGTGHYVFDVKEAILENNIEHVMTNLYRKIRTLEYPVKHVVIDNVSELIQMLLHHYTEVRKKDFPEIREHGDTAYKIMEWLSNWRDLVDIGINVVFNCWEYPYDIQNSDGTVVTKTCPMLGKASTFRACGLVDAVGHLESVEKTGKRYLRFGPSNQYLTKSQFSGLFDSNNPSGCHPPDLNNIINILKNYDYTKKD